jgi:hypothetical protein
MTSQLQNNSAGPYRQGSGRSPELRRSNRKVGLIVTLVVVCLVIFTFIYVTWFGGTNIGPQAPIRSQQRHSEQLQSELVRFVQVVECQVVA